jgi:hypothetical protein
VRIGKYKYILIVVIIFLNCLIVLGDSPLIYLSPLPGAKWVSIQSTIILRLDEELTGRLDPSRLLIQVNGEKSGYHEGSIFLAADQKTYIFKPDQYFSTNEIVDVNIIADSPGYKNQFSYQFSTSLIEKQDYTIPDETITSYYPPKEIQSESDKITNVINGVAVPNDFPYVTVDKLQDTAPGRLFLATAGNTPYILILENDGTPYYYQRLSNYSRDFKEQPTGKLIRLHRGVSAGYVVMDSNFQTIDTLRCGNGYGTDQHEAQLLPNGNFLLIGVDVQPVDMSVLVEGGSPDARVIGNHVVEHDPQGNVIFEWRSWDNFNILDAQQVNFRDLLIDYVHMNSIAVDYDDNLIVSSRHFSEVTKLNRQTGEVMWRLGGKNNQFEIVNDVDSISYQHDARPVPGADNHYTIFDNGNHKLPQYSRAVEFAIDTSMMTATKVWEYRHTPDRYGYAMGNVQRLPNGNTLINWSGNPDPVATEVNPEGEIVYEMDFVGGIGNYRTFRFDWSGMLEVPYLILEKYDDRVTLIFNKFGDSTVTDYIIYAGLEPNPATPIDTTAETWIDLTDFKYNQRYYFRVTALNQQGEESGLSNEVNTLINFIPPGENMILNGDFKDGDFFWDFFVFGEASASGIVEDGFFHITIDSSGTSELDIQLKQGDLALQESRHYLLAFDAYAGNPRTIDVSVEKASAPFDDYSRIGFVFVETGMKSYSYPFEMTHPSDSEAQLVFNCGYEEPDIYFDNISLKEDVSSVVKDEIETIPEKYQLTQNHPNPFNPKTIINYEIPITNDIELNVYNLLGQKVVTLVSEKQPAGQYQVEWDASAYASGIYYYILRSGDFQDVKKMIILK